MKSVLHEPAVLEVGQWLCAFPNVQTMQPAALAPYSASRKVRAGWTVDLRNDLGPDGLLAVLLTDNYPHAAPIVAVGRDKYLVWPHVERDGVLCLLNNAATLSAYRPVGVLKSLLNEAVCLVKACLSPEIQEDFRSEFHSYWSRETTEDEREVYSILDDRPGTRMVFLWPGRTFFVVGESEQIVSTWLTNVCGERGKQRRCEETLLLELDKALVPAEYPKSGEGLAAIAKGAGSRAYSLFRSILTSTSRPTVLLRAPTANGTALAMVRLNTEPRVDLRGRQLDKSLRGFRAHTIKPALLDARLLARAERPNRYEVSRADGPWVHGRGKDLQAQALQEKRVVLFGAGSVGGSVAELLAQAGVGKLAIVDPEKLVFANASRHILGADSVGKYKATGVAALLQKRFPHSDISGVRSSLEEFVKTGKDHEEWDLALALTGDWAANAFINEVFQRSPKFKQLLVGWSEAHALAGHAVLLRSRESCLVCGFYDDGLPRFRVAHWEETTLESEPACGGIFQPYGAVEIAAVKAMISGAALKGLLNTDPTDAHAIYAAEESEIQRSGGRLTDEWVSRTPNFPRDVKLIKEFGWAKRLHCEACGVHNAVNG